MTYDEELERVLRRATAVFAEKGYHPERSPFDSEAYRTGLKNDEGFDRP